MILKKLLILLLSLVIGVYSLSALARKQEYPEVTENGLHRVHDSQMAIVYAKPGADLAPYSRVILQEPIVAFKKNWKRDQWARSASKLNTSSRVNTQKIEQDLAQELETVFTEALNSGGYTVVTKAEDDVLQFARSLST